MLLLMLGGCAHALKEPPPLEEMAGKGPAHPREEVDVLLSRASLLFASRRIEDVKGAAALWIEAAAADPSRTEGLIGAARARVWLTEHESELEARRRAATEAVQAAEWCRRIAPDDPACQYWLGAALGVQARERPSTGLSALPQIEQAFKRAAAEAPELEAAGADRALALLYLRAPAWPTGPGDPDRGLEHARRAVALAPDYPPNHLVLGEALRATGDPKGSREAYSRALQLAITRHAKGDPDAGEWIAEAGEASP